jgi:hypothetical protein
MEPNDVIEAICDRYVVAFLMCVASPGWAQMGKGALSGIVVDAQGGALQGAKVVADPGGSSALSDAQGQFTLNGLSAGEYDVTVSYAGFAPFTKKMTVMAGQPARLDASLSVAASKQDIQVYAGREGGEIEAINRTFNADNIINVLPADVIKSLPNANVADAIGRLPSVTLERDEGEGKYVQVRGTEPRLTNVTIDGVNIASAETVRQVKLDIIHRIWLNRCRSIKRYRRICRAMASAGRWICERRARATGRRWHWSRPAGIRRLSGGGQRTSSMGRSESGSLKARSWVCCSADHMTGMAVGSMTWSRGRCFWEDTTNETTSITAHELDSQVQRTTGSMRPQAST